MKILVIGSGGREHAIVWKLKKSPLQPDIVCLPGNAGILQSGTCFPVRSEDIPHIMDVARKIQPDLTVIGPEAPLALGLADDLRAGGFLTFGPSQKAAQLESSKIFSKIFMRDNGIPTADFDACDSFDAACHSIKRRQGKCVIKADGLAAGKGVIVCHQVNEAVDAARKMMVDKEFGAAGSAVIVEDLLDGEEVSIMAICDETTAIILESSQDHKRAFDGDLGPNTGGMGAYSPAPVADSHFCDCIRRDVIEPVLEGMQRMGHPFTGVLYAGLMVCQSGYKVLEFNVRFGDPETQCVLFRMKSDLLEIIMAAAENRLNTIPEIEWYANPSICVVLTSKGYPGSYTTAYPITGLDHLMDNPDVVVFHAGTKVSGSQIVTAGGRVLNVTAKSDSLKLARRIAEQAIEKINYTDKFYRKDIGWRVINR